MQAGSHVTWKAIKSLSCKLASQRTGQPSICMQEDESRVRYLFGELERLQQEGGGSLPQVIHAHTRKQNLPAAWLAEAATHGTTGLGLKWRCTWEVFCAVKAAHGSNKSTSGWTGGLVQEEGSFHQPLSSSKAHEYGAGNKFSGEVG